VHLLQAVAIHSSEMHALITSPRFGISMCSMVLQKQQIKNVKRPPFILVQNEETICIAIFLFCFRLK